MRLPAPWRALLGGADARGAASPAQNLDVFARSGQAEPDALDRRLAEIEALALDIYRAKGLPTDAGHYARGPRTGAWKFVSDTLTPEERFALVQANPPERGWRFGRLADLGRLSDDQDLQAAGAVLDGAARVRALRGSAAPAQALLDVIDLGAAWAALKLANAVPPKAPARCKPDRRRKKT